MTAKAFADLIADILRQFMSHPDEVRVEVIPLSRSATIKIDVNPGEVGRVIGEGGAHFKAIRKLALAFTAKTAIRLNVLDMIEPENVTPEKYGKFKGRSDWPKQELTLLLLRTAKAVFKRADDIEIACNDDTNFVSVFTVRVAADENFDVVEIVQDALGPIFNAVGRPHGRVLIVDVVSGAGPVKGRANGARQPRSAAGRNCPEVRR